MNRQTLIRRITAENDGKIFISQKRAMEVLGVGRETFTAMMDGYDYRLAGRNHAKMYFVDDVADAWCRS